jgi:hypothetical protein
VILSTGASDRWSMVMKRDWVGFQTKRHVPKVTWAILQVVLELLQGLWIKKLEIEKNSITGIKTTYDF